MSVNFRDTQVPLFIKIEKNIINDIKNILIEENLIANNPLILISKTVKNLENINLNSLCQPQNILISNDSSITAAEKIKDQILTNAHDAIIAIGGGQVLDVGKYAATKANVNYISVPTSPSHDGIASPIAVLTDGNNLKQSMGVNMPTGIIVDLDIIKKAPLKNIQAGTGDLLSNFSALADWKLAHMEKQEKIDDFAMSLAYSAADLIYGNVDDDYNINIYSDKFLLTLINGLVLSGIAMHISGNSRPCSGAEHKISHAIDKLFPNTAMHGEQVALGIIITEKLRNSAYYNNYKKLFKNLSLPTHYQDINLTHSQMIEVLKFAPQTRPDRYTILEKLNLDDFNINQLLNEL
ncbi:MAG: iron-containing alcohol dehydrogenase family protein [Patescibacteria group bacterium]